MPLAWRPRCRIALATGVAGILLGLAACVTPASAGDARHDQARSAARGPAAGTVSQLPLLAYFYIWFNPSSWNRAKMDYPLLGRYSSGDAAIMRQQIAMAKRAGITGFLVSWKDTPLLDGRLATLRSVAAAAHFKLGIVFEGRDFHGSPLPMSEVRQSFGYLASHYAKDPVFNIFGKPLVTWSGTWTFSAGQLASVTHAYGSRLDILAMEEQPGSYQRVARLFDGDAYYWSSADPLHTPGYAAKLRQFSATVHRSHGLWIAPAAPGFDARLIGGTRVIPRRNGKTLRLALDAAVASSPDAVGVISWNEYSENSDIEPSRLHGTTALRVIAAVEHASAPAVTNFDSSQPAGYSSGSSKYLVLGVFVLLLGGSVAIALRRR